MTNPFRNTIVASPWETTSVDVPTIHSHVFDECLRGVEHVRRQRRSAALIIHGEAGSGKTHLLRRLRAQLTPQQQTASDRDEYLFVWVRLQTSPRMIWRTVRRTLVDDWFRPVPGGRPQIERILFHRLANIRVATGDLEPWYDYMLQEDPEGLRQLITQIADELNLDRNTAVAFEHIAFGRHRRDLHAWLAGDSLPEAALARLDLAQDEGTDEEREDQSRQVVLMLCRLAGNGLPVVLSFDQVEALQMNPGDREALFPFGQLTSTLHDATTNVLVVSCVQSACFAELKAQARGADYDRMTSLGAFSLDPLNVAQAEQLIAARVAELRASLNDLPAAASWPLLETEFQQLLAGGFISPRKLLCACAERFESQTRSAPRDESANMSPSVAEPPAIHDAAAFLAIRWAARFEQKLEENRPENTEEILRHGFPLLVRLVMPHAKLVQDDLLQDVSLVFDLGTERTGISLCTQANMTSLSARLKRLKNQFAEHRLQRLVIVRDSRIPLTTGAKAARQNLEELQRAGVLDLHPTLESLAALDAMRELLSDAKAGDLDCYGTTIEPDAVEAWLNANLSRAMGDFVDDVFGKRSKAAALVDEPSM